MLSCFKGEGLEAGCDEAGRGCLAGPVVAAAVILTHDFDHPLLNDSKRAIAAMMKSYNKLQPVEQSNKTKTKKKHNEISEKKIMPYLQLKGI